jgi:methionyl-tRNA formyltransferase
MKTVFLCGGSRHSCLNELIKSKLTDLKAVITPIVTRKNRDRLRVVLRIAKIARIPTFHIRQDELYSLIKNIKAQLLISVGYPYLIDRKIIKLVKYAINLHPTLLPKYRGYRSGPYIILNDETKTGVTVHFITDSLDAGDIIFQQEVALTKFDTVKSMMNKTSKIEGQALCEAIKRLKDGSFKRIKQKKDEATTYTYKRMPKDSFIDWNKSLKELYNVVRACDPKEYPAYFYVDGQKVCIKMWRPIKSSPERDTI